MNDADRKAFEEALLNRCKTIVTVHQDFDAGWQAALEWRDSQVGEPVGEVIDHERACLFGNQKLKYGALLYTSPPAAQINQQLVDALQFVIDCQESTNGSDYESGSALREAAQIAKAALAAANHAQEK